MTARRAKRSLADPLSVRFALDPHPAGREFLRALRAWRAGREYKGQTLTATLGDEGSAITPDGVDWDSVPEAYHTASASGPSGIVASEDRRAVPVRIDRTQLAALDAWAAGKGTTRTAALSRAIRELIER